MKKICLLIPDGTIIVTTGLINFAEVFFMSPKTASKFCLCTWLLIIQYAYNSSPLFFWQKRTLSRKYLDISVEKNICLALADEPMDRSKMLQSGQLPDHGFKFAAHRNKG